METESNESLWQPIKAELDSAGFEISGCIAANMNALLLKGKQILMQREVVIKVLNSNTTDTAFERFQNEAKALATFQHSNIVGLYGVGRLADGRLYMVMEFVDGQTLQQLLKAKVFLSEEEIRRYGAQICAALDYAHSKDIVHRDLKPANVMITHESGMELAKLIDFGIHKSTTAGAQQLTLEGNLPGSANYMSPEQCQGGMIDQRSDIYSLGCVLYELCCSKPPMDAESDWMIMANHQNKEIKEVPSKEPISKELYSLILNCLSKNPEFRPANALSVKSILDHKFTTLVEKKRKLTSFGKNALLVVAALLLVCLIFAGAYWFKEHQPEKIAPLNQISLRPYAAFVLHVQDLPAEKQKVLYREWLSNYLEAGSEGTATTKLGSVLEKCDIKNWKERDSIQKLIWSYFDKTSKVESLAKFESEIGCYALLEDFPHWRATIHRLMTSKEPLIKTDSARLLLKWNGLLRVAKPEFILEESNYLEFVPNIQNEKAALLSDIATTYAQLGQRKESELYLSKAVEAFLNNKIIELNYVAQYSECLALCLAYKPKITYKLADKFPMSEMQTTLSPLGEPQKSRNSDYIAICYLEGYLQVNSLAKAKLLIERLSKDGSFLSARKPNSKGDKVLGKPAVLDTNAEESLSNLCRFLKLEAQYYIQRKDKNHVKAILHEIIALLKRPSCVDNFELARSLEAICGAYPEFVDAAVNAIKSAKPREARLILGNVYTTAGHRLRSLNQPQKAIQYYEFAHQNFEGLSEFLEGNGVAYLAEAECYTTLGQYAKAEDYVNRGLHWKGVRIPSETYFAMLNCIGSARRAQGRLKEALSFQLETYDKLLPIRDAYPNHFAAAVDLLAASMEADGQKEETLKFIDHNLPLLDPKGELVGTNIEDLQQLKARLLAK